MQMIANILVGLLALLHFYILVLEMFMWDKPKGMKAFGTTQEFATQSKALAANQGLYNGFLGAGLLWGLIQGTAGFEFKIFFSLCVVVAGVYGAMTANKKILFVQAMPGLITLIFIWLAK